MFHFQFNVYACFFCAPNKFLMPTEVRRGCQTLWNWSYRQYVSYHEDAENLTLIFERTVKVLKLWAPRKVFFLTSVLHTVYLDMMLLHRTVWASMLEVKENQRLSDSLYCGTGFDTVSGTEPTLSPASEENSGQTAKGRHSWAEVSRSFQAISNVCKLLHTWDARGNDRWKSRRTSPLAIVSQFSGHWEASSFYQSDCPSPGHNTAIKRQWYFIYFFSCVLWDEIQTCYTHILRSCVWKEL